MLRDAARGDRNLVAGLKFRAAHAILPGLQGQGAALHLVESNFVEELGHISEGKDGIQLIILGFLDQGFDQLPAHALRLGLLIHRQRADFAERGGVEVQGAAAQQPRRRA